MNVDKAVRRNPFWQIVQNELPKHGFKEFHPEHSGNSNFVVVIHGLDSSGQPHKQKYHFPKIGKSFESTLNFKSALKNFIRQELPNRGFHPPVDHRTRQPGRFIAHINHDVEKKVLTPPKTMLKAVADLKPETLDVIAPPTIPEPQVKVDKTIEPLSDRMMLAVFLVDRNDLAALIEAAQVMTPATFRGSKPAPLRICPPPTLAAPKPQPVQPQLVQEQPVVSTPVVTPKPAVQKSRMSAQDMIANRIYTDINKVWQTHEFKDLVKSPNSLGANMSLLTSAERIQRVGVGKYKAFRS